MSLNIRLFVSHSDVQSSNRNVENWKVVSRTEYAIRDRKYDSLDKYK